MRRHLLGAHDPRAFVCWLTPWRLRGSQWFRTARMVKPDGQESNQFVWGPQVDA